MRLRTAFAVTVATCSVGLVTGGNPPASAAVPPGSSLLGLQPGNVLVRFDADAPAVLTQSTPVTGLLDGESLVGFDVRPATGALVAVGVAGTSGHVYVVDALSGVAQPVSPTPFSTTLPAGGTWSVDFNPTVDRIRLVHSSGASLRLNPNNGAIGGTDTALAPATPGAVAYDRSTPATPTATTLFAVDTSSSELLLVGGVDGMPSPNGGVTSVRGGLGIATDPNAAGFDIAADGTAFASLTVGGSTGLYTIDLSSGAASGLGAVGDGSTPLLDLATQRPAAGQALVLQPGNTLATIDLAAPAAAGPSTAISGLEPGDVVVGMDVRPATGEVIALGVAGASGNLYRIDPVSGAATRLGAAPFATTLPAGGTWAVDFNPTVDRIRLVHSSGANYRLNPNTGGLAGTDTTVGPDDANAVAYDRSVAVATQTTLYAIDAAASTLGLIGGADGMPSPNLGATSVVGPLGVTIEDGIVAFDITPVGEALAVFRVGGATTLHRVDLASGRAADVGLVGDGTADALDLVVLPALPDGAGQFVPIAATRLVDTRQGGGARPARGSTTDVAVVGSGGVPADATSVVLNVTGDAAEAAGFLTVYPTGETVPTASTNNLVAGGTKANLVVAKVGAGGAVSILNDAGAHLIVDVVGYHASPTGVAGRFTAIPGSRVLDTRESTPVAAGGTVDATVVGRFGVPDTGVSAVAINLTATRSVAPGYFVAYPAGEDRPATSNLNVRRAGESASNLTIVPVGADGKITVFAEQGADVVVDVAGWYSDGTGKGGYSGLYVPVSPARVLDTRNAIGTTAGALERQGSVDVVVGGNGGIPANGVVGVAVNVTAVDVVGAGYLTVYPTGIMWPTASNVNADGPGSTTPNLVVSPLGMNGSLTIFDDAGGHVLVDVAGWFTK